MPAPAATLQRDIARQVTEAKVPGEHRLQAAEKCDNDHDRQYPLEHHVRPFIEEISAR